MRKNILFVSLCIAGCGDDGSGSEGSTSDTDATTTSTAASEAGPGSGSPTSLTGDASTNTTTSSASSSSTGTTSSDDTSASGTTTGPGPTSDTEPPDSSSSSSTGTPLGDCDGTPVLVAGAEGVYMEAELIAATASWTEESNPAFDGFSGSYFQWIDEFTSAPGDGETALEYCFAVETEGTYWLEIHGRRDRDPGTFCESSENDGCNDVWVQIDGQGSGDQTWTKKMQSGPFGEWRWDGNWDPQNGSPFRTELELTAGPHLLGIAGRSQRVKIDAIRIYLAETDPPGP